MWMNAMARQLHDHLMVVVLVMLGAVISVGCDSRETILMIEKPTEIHSIEQTPSSASDSQSANVQPGKVLTILKAGETALVVGVYHGQDSDSFKVKLVDGTEGLILAGDTFKVVSR
jgi:hypothetical protein